MLFGLAGFKPDRDKYRASASSLFVTTAYDPAIGLNRSSSSSLSTNLLRVRGDQPVLTAGCAGHRLALLLKAQHAGHHAPIQLHGYVRGRQLVPNLQKTWTYVLHVGCVCMLRTEQ